MRSINEIFCIFEIIVVNETLKMILFLLVYYIFKEIIDLRKVIFVDLIYGKYQFHEDIFTLKY